MADVLDLTQLLNVKHVPVVQHLDLGPLEKLLQQLLQGQEAAQKQIQVQQAEIDALKAAQADQLQGNATDGTTSADATPGSLQDQLAALDTRLADVESRISNLSPAQHEGALPQQAASAAVADGQHDNGTSSTAASPDSTALPAEDAQHAAAVNDADVHGLRMQQQQLAKQLADVAAASKGLQQQVSALQDSKADRSDIREMLADGLKSKADSSTVNQLKTQLADKADRSELDALLNALSSSGDTSGDAASRAMEGVGSDTLPAAAAASSASAPDNGSQGAAADSSLANGHGSSRRSTKERESSGDLAQQLSKLQLQVALLQDRVNKKADSQPVADLSDGLEAAGNQISDLARALQDLKQQLATAHSNLGDLKDSLSSHAADTALHALSGMPAQGDGPVSSSGSALQERNTGSGALSPESPADETAVTAVTAQGVLPAAGSAAAGCMDPNTLQQPQQLLAELAAKVAALEATVSELSIHAAGTVNQQRRVSGEQPASSKLVQALAAQLTELGSHVARLSMQVQAGNSTSAQTQQGSTPVDTADAADATTSGSLGPAGDPADSAGAPTAAYQAAGAAGAAGVMGSGFGAELAAELDGRMSDLEQLVQDLSVIKADQESLQDLRALLADTATQNDTDQIRQKLSTQQSILDRIMRQLSSTSGNSSNRGSRPQSASGGSNSQHSTAGPVVPEYSFMGADAGGAGLGAQWGAQYHSSSAAADGASGDAGLLTALHEQLQAHHDSLEQLAEAVSLLATGQAAAAAAPAGSRAAPGAAGGIFALQVESEGVDLAAGRLGASGEDGSVPETPNLRFQRGPTAAAGSSGTAGGAAAGRPGTPLGASHGRAGSMQPAGPGGIGGAGRWEGQVSTATTAAVLHAGPGPQVARLKRLLQTGQVGRKMDWFDPTLLQKMAQRLAAIDVMLRNGAAGGATSGGGSGDLDSKLKRLAGDVRVLKERLAELAGAGLQSGQGGWRALGQASDGDHSMLSGKPLGGYRCMACDRPLAALDARPGPYLPTGQLPVSLASGAEVAAGAGVVLGKLPPASTASRRCTAEAAASPSASALASDPMAASNSPDASSKRLVGPQNWYTATRGLPAEQLPKGDVGPHLPPGGWRGNQQASRGEEASPVLPLLRGGSAASGSAVTPRGPGDKAAGR